MKTCHLHLTTAKQRQTFCVGSGSYQCMSLLIQASVLNKIVYLFGHFLVKLQDLISVHFSHDITDNLIAVFSYLIFLYDLFSPPRQVQPQGWDRDSFLGFLIIVQFCKVHMIVQIYTKTLQNRYIVLVRNLILVGNCCNNIKEPN